MYHMTERKKAERKEESNAVLPLRLPGSLLRRVDDAVKGGAAASRSEFVRSGIELALQANDPKYKSAMSMMLTILVRELAPNLESAFERIGPEMIAKLQDLNSPELEQYFMKLFGVGDEHTKKRIDREIEYHKAKRKRSGKVA